MSIRRILTPVVLLTLLFPSFALGDGLIRKVTGRNWPEVVELSNLEKREGIFCKRFTEIPFTGKVTGRFQGSLKDGKREGPGVSYYKDGNVKKTQKPARTARRFPTKLSSSSISFE